MAVAVQNLATDRSLPKQPEAVFHARGPSKIYRMGVRPEEALELVGLGNRMKHFPAQLSGGEQQRVAIARAVAKRPEVLLCDEPTGALDYATGKIVLDVIERVNRELGTTTAVITHNAAIAGMADRVVLVLRVPVSALFRRGEGWSVFVVENGIAHLRNVEVDHRTPFEAEVKSGLEEGAEVIIHPSNQISDGARVATGQTPA